MFGHMKLLLLALLLSFFCVGCRSPGVLGQPKLHSPVPPVRGTNDLWITNRSAAAVSNVFERVYANTNNNILAYIQISADQDVAEEFGKTFASCFYVGEVIIENKNTNTFLAYGAS